MSELKQNAANVGDLVISRIEELSKANFHLPKGYDAVSAVKMSMLKLQEVKDKNGVPALECCSKESIQTALFQMCCRGLNMAFSQCYPIVKNGVLCVDDSYFGMILQVKRIYPDWTPKPRVVRQDDVFEYAIDPKTGIQYLVKHETKIENKDKDFIAAYMYTPLPNGEQDLYVMSKKEILTAWGKSPTNQGNHKLFVEKYVGKTIINSGCRQIINSNVGENTIGNDDEETTVNASKQIEPVYQEYEEVTETVDHETGEIIQPDPKPEKKPVGRPKKEEVKEDKVNSDVEF